MHIKVIANRRFVINIINQVHMIPKVGTIFLED